MISGEWLRLDMLKLDVVLYPLKQHVTNSIRKQTVYERWMAIVALGLADKEMSRDDR